MINMLYFNNPFEKCCFGPPVNVRIECGVIGSPFVLAVAGGWLGF